MKERLLVKNRIKLITQTTISECGLCCIAMVANYYGYYQPISYYRNIYRIGRDGLDISQMFLILKKIGLAPKAFKLNYPEDFDFKDTPYILLTNNNHFVVIKKNNNKINIWDPASGKMTVDKGDLSTLNGGIILEIKVGDNFKPNNKYSNDYRHLIKFFSDVKLTFLALLLFSILTYLISSIVPLMLEKLIDLMASDSIFNINNVIFKLFILLCSFFIVNNLQNVFLVKLQADLNKNINVYTTEHLINLPFSYFDNRGEENILYRMGLLPQLVDTISNNFVQSILNIFGIFTLSIYLCYRFSELTLIVVSSVFILGFLLICFNVYIMNKKQEEMLKESDVKTIQTEIISMILQIKSSRLGSYFINQYKNLFDTYNICNKKNKKSVYLFNLIINTYSLFIPVIIIIYSYLKFRVTPGEMFFIYSMLGLILSNSMLFFSVISNLIIIKPSLHYLNDIYDEKRTNYIGTKTINEFKALELNDVSFRYNDVGKNILSNINLHINKNEKVSIVGLSGSGKSTLIKLLSGLYDNYSGCIKINDISIKDIHESFFTNELAIVTQNAAIFNKTIKDNVTLGNSNITDEEIYRSLEMVNLSETIKSLPMGIYTVMNNKGGNFSGGQSQRLAIARAIAKKPSILVLDEATSSLDPVNEKIIYNNLKNYGISILSISHRLSTVIDSDRIYVIDGGKIVEVGNHKELMSFDSVYHQMYSGESTLKENI